MALNAVIDQAQALIFDCDGTLADSAALYTKAWTAGFRECGLKMSPDWYRDHNGLSEEVLIEAFETEAGVRIDDPTAVINAMRQTYLAELSLLSEMTIVAQIARRFHGSKPMAVASGGPRSLVTASLNRLGLDYLFATIVTIEDVRYPKPAPDIFLEAARRLGVLPHGCLVFEDSRQGFESARGAGCRVINVANLQTGKPGAAAIPAALAEIRTA